MPYRQLSIKIDHPGLQTTIQDLGRPGYQAEGIPLGGALDRQAALQANYLVGNSLPTPLLEITLMGPKLIFEQEAQIAITGADLSPSIDGAPAPMYQTIHIAADSILRFGKPKRGCRAYLAVGGQWRAQQWLSSASLATQHPERLTPDSQLQKGNRIFIDIEQFIKARQVRPDALPDPTDTTLLELIAGPEFELVNRSAIAHFFAQSYTITPASNRMGYRLDPALPDFSWPQENISSGIVPGTIQITNSGQPIVLLADAQTVGGYPRIANLTEESLNTVAQLRPGDQLRFQLRST